MKNFYLFRRTTLLLLLISISALSFSQIPSDFLEWKFSAGEIYSAPLLVDSTVYIGDLKGKFSKLNANTGEEIWSYKAENYIASRAAYKNGVVVFEAGERLHGLNAQTGELLWSYKSTDKASTPGQATNYQHSSPVIEGNTAYFGDLWGNMNGVNIKTGALDFQYKIAVEYSDAKFHTIHSTPVIKDSIIYFGDYGSRCYAISLKDKSEKWVEKVESPQYDGSFVSTFVIDNGMLFCGRYSNSLIPLDIETGKPIWKFEEKETFLPSTPVFYNDDVIIGTTINSNHIFSLKKATGEKNWEISVKGIFFVKPIIIHDSILVMNSTDPFTDQWGILYFIDLNRGKIINEVHLQYSTESSPILYNDMILIGKNDGLYAFHYKPYFEEPGASNFSFDDSEENITINANEVLSKNISLTNNSNFCDSINLDFEIEGDASKSNIIIAKRTNFHLRTSQKFDVAVKAKAKLLTPGEYTIKLTLTSNRQTGDFLFKKTIHLIVEKATGITTLNNKACKVFPNPFTDKVFFELEDQTESTVQLKIASITGQPIYTTNTHLSTIKWDGCDEKGNPIPKGIYIYQLSSEKGSSTGKIIKN